MSEPLVKDSQLSRWILAIVSTVLTLGLGWAVNSLNKINTVTTQTQTTLNGLQTWSYNMETEVTETNTRIDDLFQNIEVLISDVRKELQGLDDRVRLIEIELAARRQVVASERPERIEKEQKILEEQVPNKKDE